EQACPGTWHDVPSLSSCLAVCTNSIGCPGCPQGTRTGRVPIHMLVSCNRCALTFYGAQSLRKRLKTNGRKMGKNILITGGAGYVGTMLIEQFAECDSIDTNYGVNLRDRPAQCADCAKLRWLQADVAEQDWVATLEGAPIDVVIHCAYQIRELYGRQRQQQEHWNIDGARQVFDFALRHPSVRRIVH